MSIVKIIFYFLLLILLISLSNFFSASETAFLSLNKIQLKQAVKEKRKHARLISKMHSKLDSLLSTILVGNNIVNVFSSSLATALALSIIGEKGEEITTLAMTVLIIIFGEILPKTLASVNPFKYASRNSPLLRFFYIILTPVTFIFSVLSKGMNKFISLFDKTKQPVITEEELKTLIEMGNKEGTIESSEKHILNNIVDFGDLRVRDIMKPCPLIYAIEENSTYDQILDMFALSGHSKLPVYKNSLDTIVGILNFKDMFDEKNFNIKTAMRKACYVPETITTLSVLRYMKKERQNIAIVVDEHGINRGLVTMDDVLGTVLGRTMHVIDAESEDPLNRIRVLKPNQFLVPGEIKLTDLNAAFSLNLESEFFNTLGGWLLERFGYLPSVGEVTRYNNVIFEIEDQAQRRIKAVKITLVEG